MFAERTSILIRAGSSCRCNLISRQGVCHNAQSSLEVADDIFGNEAAGHQGNLQILHQPITRQVGVRQSLTLSEALWLVSGWLSSPLSLISYSRGVWKTCFLMDFFASFWSNTCSNILLSKQGAVKKCEGTV